MVHGNVHVMYLHEAAYSCMECNAVIYWKTEKSIVMIMACVSY